jgi:hypothetical protein
MASRGHHSPDDGIECRICGDSGLYRWENEWRVCMGPHTEGKREELQNKADESNTTMRAMEAKLERRRR